MNGFAPGDLVIRIPGKHCPPGWPMDHTVPAPPEGRAVRLADVIPFPAYGGQPACLGLVIEGYPSPHWSRSWAHYQYRKLNDEPDNAELVQRIKRCKPVKIGQPA